MTPDFADRDFLRDHALWVMNFYGEQALDPTGGFFHYFLDDGRVYERHRRHLVSATRFVVTHAVAYELSGDPVFRDRAAHALRFLEQAFRDRNTDGYHWLVRWQDGRSTPLDSTRHMYGLAFVMLAAARAARIGVDGATPVLYRAFELAERRFFEPAAQLYADEATPDWEVSLYRGQNANMHACEALIAAFEATQDSRFIERAEALAESVTVRLARFGDGDIWEHYRPDWSPDWDYNRHDDTNIFRPWGYQPGHLTEWAKLLCQLDGHRPSAWHLPRAVALFDRAWSVAWDRVHGGMHYGFAPDGSICHPAKYHWVQAETFAAAGLLAARTGESRFVSAYLEQWRYCWEHFVDHEQGAWFRILTPDNFNLTREKSPAGKVDYHDIGACYDVWRALGDASRLPGAPTPTGNPEASHRASAGESSSIRTPAPIEKAARNG
jgi:mannose/cellobiose epimerase-like protein (N-acyl-D-glucosamine 2-epimerase family)